MESDATLSEAPPGGPDGLGRQPTRRRFIEIGTAAGAGSALALALAACGKSKTGPPAQKPSPSTEIRFGQGDLGVVNYLLVVEYLQVELYETARRRLELKGRAKELFRRFEQQEREHVDMMRDLVNLMAGDPPRQPKANFAVGSQEEVVRFTAQFEALAAAAFLGQVGNLTDESLLETILGIHAVEARQAAALSELTGGPASPDGAFAKARTQPQVLRRIDPITARAG
jgi:hypothetical protein